MANRLNGETAQRRLIGAQATPSVSSRQGERGGIADRGIQGGRAGGRYTTRSYWVRASGGRGAARGTLAQCVGCGKEQGKGAKRQRQRDRGSRLLSA